MIDDGYSVCFNEWVLDSHIRNELPLLLMISSLTAKTGECFANNKYFAELFNVNEDSVSRWLRKLIKLKYVTVVYEKRGAEVIKRRIRLTKMSTDDRQNCQPTDDKNVGDNNTSINNIKKINKKTPTKEQVEEYAKSRNRLDLVDKFWNFFSATDWVDSNGKEVKNWKAKFLTWESHTEKPKESRPRTWWRD